MLSKEEWTQHTSTIHPFTLASGYIKGQGKEALGHVRAMLMQVFSLWSPPLMLYMLCLRIKPKT